MILNEKQLLAIDKINIFIDQLEKKYFYLFGFAGTGKTLILTIALKNLLKKNKINNIYICAPTHKALNVIESYFKSDLDKDLDKINFMTIQKLLEFKPIIMNDDGSKIFKSFKESKFLKKIENTLVVVDECSMISNEILIELEKYINMYQIKVIFLGDDAQLPPVNEHVSKIFSQVPKNYKFYILLDEVMRTASIDIKEVSMIIRKWNFNDPLINFLIPIHNKKNDQKTFYLYHKKTDIINSSWFKYFIRKLNSNNVSIILTWTNRKCDMYNSLIRQHLQQNKDLNNYLVGDCLMFNNFYNSDGTLFYTADMIKILDVNRSTITLFDWHDLLIIDPKTVNDKGFNILINKLIKLDHKFSVDNLTVERLYSDINNMNDGSKYQIITISLHELNKYNDFLKNIKQDIEFFFRKYKSENLIAQIWNIYHKKLIDPYAELNFGYSITTHKSQGSTFSHVIVDVNDIYENPNLMEMKQCLYTATTRAHNELSFIV